MKKIIIGSFVGAILIFVWQATSWMVLPFHKDAFKYTAAQDSALAVFPAWFKEEGQYILPRPAEGASENEHEAFRKDRIGKPWAVVSYHRALDGDMVMPIIRGFLIHLICVWLVVLVVRRIANKTFSSVFWTVFTFGLICFLFVSYTAHNWMGTPWSVLKGELIDDLVGWGLCGIWLGWYFTRR